jgi:alanine racemase
VSARATARVDLGALQRNVARLHKAAPGAAMCAVVKADGYGHGASDCARAARNGGAEVLAVATAAEAQQLRDLGDDGRVLVLGALSGAEEVKQALAARAEISVWDAGFAALLPDDARAHVKLDTGMGRLGTRDPVEATAVADSLAQRGALAGLWTHFATADDLNDDSFFAAQLRLFSEWVMPLKQRNPAATVHCANSAATLRSDLSHFDMVRCGVAIYGMDPYGEDPFKQDLEPVLSLTSYVAAVKTAARGDSTGYGRSFVATEPTTVATIPIGYGDGVRRLLSNNCEVLIGGKRRELIGNVSMDNITVRGDGCEFGDEVVLIGKQDDERVLAEEWALRLKTINYEVTCGLSSRVAREPFSA